MTCIVERLRTRYKVMCRRCEHFNCDMTTPHEVMDAAASEIEILRSKVQSMGRIINHINGKNAQLSRRIHTLGFVATGNPTPRIVRQIKQIRAAAGTNSANKIVELVERGLTVIPDDDNQRTVSDGFGGEWMCCNREDCGLEVVRPGKVQCWCDQEGGP